MGLFLWLVALQVVVFGIIVFFLRVIFSRNVTQATTHISELNEDYTQKLEEAKKRSQDADKYYDEMLLKAKHESEKTRIQILKEANDSQQLILNQSHKQSEEIIEKAEKAKEALMGELNQRIKEGAHHSACELIQKILPATITKSMHKTWMDELLLHGLEELDRLNISKDLKEVKIISAYELSPQEKSTMEKKISAKLGREILFKNETDVSLIAGMKVSLGSVLIDGSLKFKIQELSRRG